MEETIENLKTRALTNFIGGTSRFKACMFPSVNALTPTFHLLVDDEHVKPMHDNLTREWYKKRWHVHKEEKNNWDAL